MRMSIMKMVHLQFVSTVLSLLITLCDPDEFDQLDWRDQSLGSQQDSGTKFVINMCGVVLIKCFVGMQDFRRDSDNRIISQSANRSVLVSYGGTVNSFL